MYFVIGSAFILLCGSVAAQQAAVASPADASQAVQECYSPKVWAYCAALDGSALPPACIDPEEPNPDPSKPKLCASSCRCADLVLESVTQNQETPAQQPSRSYPPPKLIQWGETPTPAAPATEKDLIKNFKFEESNVPSSFELAEYPEDAEMIPPRLPTVEDSKPLLNIPDREVITTDPPSTGEQNTIPPNLPPSGNEMFDGGNFNQDRQPVPLPRQQTPSLPQDPNEPSYGPQPLPRSYVFHGFERERERAV